jgi:hypothetical protein
LANTGILVWSGVTGELQNTSTFTHSAGRLWLNTASGSLHIKEGASIGSAPAAGNGAFWVKSDTPNRAMFQDDAAADHTLAYLSELNDGTVDHGSLAGLTDDDHVRYVDIDGTREQDAVRLTDRADHVNAPGGAKSELWTRTATNYPELILTDKSGLDWTVGKSFDPAQGEIPYWNVSAAGDYLTVNDNLKFNGSSLQLGGPNADLTLDRHTTSPSTPSGAWTLWLGSNYAHVDDGVNDTAGDGLTTTDTDGNEINLSWYAKNMPIMLGADMAFRNLYETNVFTGGTTKTTSDANLSWIWDPLANRWYHSYIDVSLGDACLTDSADGITWTTRKVFDTSTTSGDMSWAATDGSQVAIACDGVVFLSTDLTAANLPGTSTGNPAGTESTMMFYSVSNALWVHVGYDGVNNYIATSPNCITWTTRGTYARATYGILVAGDIVRDRDVPTNDGRICLWSDTYSGMWYSDTMTSWTLDTSSQPTTGLQVCHYCPGLNANSTDVGKGGWLGTDLEGDVWVAPSSAGTTMFETTYNCGTIWKIQDGDQGWCSNVATASNTVVYGIHAHADAAADAQFYSQIGWQRGGFSMLHSSKSSVNRAVYRWGNGVINYDRFIDAESMHGRYGAIKL